MPQHRSATRTALAACLTILATVPLNAFADINVSGNTEVLGSLQSLSTGTSSSAKSNNLSLVQGNLDSLNARISVDELTLSGLSPSSSQYTSLQAEIAQLSATASALQRILVRLQDGYTITQYTTTTDAATQTTTIDITFSGNSTLSATIPSSSTEDDEDSSSSSQTDMLTQILQNIGMQMLSGGQNPLSTIQSTLNNLVNGNAPLTPQALQQALASIMGGCATGGQPNANGVATYDIAAGKVYMPNGEVLEAHSGMGIMTDNPAYVNQPRNGPTPPNVYSLSMRESPYYGVQALRMTPNNPSAMYGRDGILAHSKLVGGNNGSHGCVAFADYSKFLAAFKRGEVTTLVVVPQMPTGTNTCTAAPVNTPNPGNVAQ